MRRTILAALAALFIATTFALDEGVAIAGNGNWPAGLAKYTFQEGVYPTSAYSGTEDTYIHNDSAGVALKIRNYGAAKVLCTTPQTYTGGEQAFMCKFTFLASDGVSGGVPANFVCTYARASFYQVGPTGIDATASVLNNQIFCYRSLYAWTEGAGTGIAAGLCNFDSASTRGYWNFDEINLNNFRWRAGSALESSANNTDSSAIGSSFFGSDTLYQSIPTVAATIATGDYKSIPFDMTSVATSRIQSAAPAPARRFGRVYWDVTHDVSLMIAGQIKNNGWIFTNDATGLSNTTLTTFASSEYVYKPRRPLLEIWGYTISSGGSSAPGTIGYIRPR